MLQVTNGVVQGSNIGGVPFSARIVKPSGAKNVRTLAPMPVVLGTTTHNTANVQKGADAELHAAYLQNIENADIEYKSWHFTVDDDSIVQHLPLTEHGFHAGDGSGPGNLQTIAVEVAENGDYAKAEYNAIILMAHLNIWLKANGKGYKSFKHQDWSGKWCPRRILGDPKRPETNRWSEYVSRVNAEIARVTNLKQPGVLYRVQTGAFKTYNLAKELETKLKAKGYDTYLVYFDGWYKVQIGAYAEGTSL